MASSTGETPIEKEFWEKYEKILAVDGERAERYAVAIMCAAAERSSNAKKALAHPATSNDSPPKPVPRKKRSKAKRAKRARIWGMKELSEWERTYMGTFGSILGETVLLIESIGEGEGILEFGGSSAAGKGKGKEEKA